MLRLDFFRVFSEATRTTFGSGAKGTSVPASYAATDDGPIEYSIYGM